MIFHGKGSKINDSEKIKMIKEALEDYRNKKLSELSTLMIIDIILNPQEITYPIIEWVMGLIKN